MAKTIDPVLRERYNAWKGPYAYIEKAWLRWRHDYNTGFKIKRQYKNPVDIVNLLNEKMGEEVVHRAAWNPMCIAFDKFSPNPVLFDVRWRDKFQKKEYRLHDFLSVHGGSNRTTIINVLLMTHFANLLYESTLPEHRCTLHILETYIPKYAQRGPDKKVRDFQGRGWCMKIGVSKTGKRYNKNLASEHRMRRAIRTYAKHAGIHYRFYEGSAHIFLDTSSISWLDPDDSPLAAKRDWSVEEYLGISTS